ncbi:MAG: hypothetical protein COA78_30355 [Blastopirellula sp.]|nr:MAG: hypothetical protein COA78_30355 [Blastopirellula sp.]
METNTGNKRKMLEDQIDLLPIGVCVVDKELNIQQWNKTLNNWTYLHAQIAIGSNLLELFPHLKSPRFLNRMTSVFNSGQTAVFSPSSTHPFLPNRLDEEGVEQVTLHKTVMVPLGGYGQLAQISLTDVTTQYEQIKELRKEKEQHRISQIRNQAILETAADSIITITSKGTIESFNTAAEHLFDYSATEVIGNNIKLLIPTLLEREHGSNLARIIESDYKNSLSQELMGKRKNETNFPICMSMSEVIIDLDHSIESTRLFTIILRDLTERHKKDKELRNSREKALAADRSKSEFLANMSHEIRTPMTAILGFNDILLESLTDPINIEAAKTIKANGSLLISLINDILDLSKVESGKTELETSTCSPHQIIANVISLMEVRLGAKDLNLDIQYKKLIPKSISTDPTKLQQILINIIGNAIKFTESGSIQVVTRLINEQTNQPKLKIDVIDSGIGIAQDRIQQVFQPFTQADSSTTRQFGGTGLGLTISKRLANLLGGDISLTSTVGQGSTFSITIATGSLEGVQLVENQLNPVPQNIRTDRPATCDLPTSLYGYRILLAEDGVDNQRLIKFILSKAGAEVTIAENGKIAFEKANKAQAENRPFDVILMDMQMPIVDGYESTQRLRNQGYTGPIIALTAHAMSGDREKCLQAGCDDFLTKPIDRNKIIGLVHQYALSIKDKVQVVTIKIIEESRTSKSIGV